MSEPKLGRLAPADAERDAIHIALTPAVAGKQLYPGLPVGLGADGRARAESPTVKVIGIVDPFLANDVQEGERFWLLLLPGTITSLRHDWTHPAFAARPKRHQASEEEDEYAPWRTPAVLALCTSIRADKDYRDAKFLADALEEAGFSDGCLLRMCRETWWRHDVERLVCLLLGGDLAASVRWIDGFARRIDQTYNHLMEAAGTYLATGDYTHDNSERYKDCWEQFPEFWKHYAVVTGKEVDTSESFFTCSC